MNGPEESPEFLYRVVEQAGVVFVGRVRVVARTEKQVRVEAGLASNWRVICTPDHMEGLQPTAADAVMMWRKALADKHDRLTAALSKVKDMINGLDPAVQR